jgi:hypothetical protein
MSQTSSAFKTETPLPDVPVVVESEQVAPFIIEQPTAMTTSQPAESGGDQKSPAALLNINRPGPGSKLISPILINAFAYPGDENKVTVQLYGEDGRLMANQLIKLQDSETGWVSFSTQIPFEINSAAESASLVLVTYDGYGRRIALINVPLILMQIGESGSESTGFQYQPFYLTKPTNASAISGGNLSIQGYAHPYNLNPLIIELVKENGAILTSKIIPIKAAAPNENYSSFSADIAYTVSETTPVRMTIRQMMDHPPYLDLAVSSITVILKP